jgi:hypothetical protein
MSARRGTTEARVQNFAQPLYVFRAVFARIGKPEVGPAAAFQQNSAGLFL